MFSCRIICKLHTKCSHWNRSLIFSFTPKCTSRQSVPRQNGPRQSAPRQSVLPQSAPHAKVPLTPKCPFMLICQSGNMSKYHPRQSGATPKCPNYPYMSKWFHAKVATTSNSSCQSVPRQSISRQNVCQPSFWTMPILIFIPVYFFFRHPLLVTTGHRGPGTPVTT